MTMLPTVLLLVASNLFMTVAWYAHLRNLADRARNLGGSFETRDREGGGSVLEWRVPLVITPG